MKKNYQIEYWQETGNNNGMWLRAHHDFDGIEGDYSNMRKAMADLAQLRRDNKDCDFRLVTR